MAVVKYKVPSQAASGADTFSDSLVGVQITDGSSQLTNTNFAIEKVIPERDSKNLLRSTPGSLSDVEMRWSDLVLPPVFSRAIKVRTGTTLG